MEKCSYRTLQLMIAAMFAQQHNLVNNQLCLQKETKNHTSLPVANLFCYMLLFVYDGCLL